MIELFANAPFSDFATIAEVFVKHFGRHASRRDESDLA